MGICSRRHFLLTICSLQLLTTIERQVFDFLGFMWAPILVNFFNIIFVILGFFGAFQYRPKYLVSYCVWNVLWLAWNIFSICFYLDVGFLNKKSDALNFGTGSFSWWQTNGPGCVVVNEITEPEIFRPSRPNNVTDCILGYEIIEVMHASTQCILGAMAIVGGICLSRVFLEEDDSFDFVGGGDDFGLAGHTPLHPMYVSYSALAPSAYPTVNSNKSLGRATATSLGSRSSFALADKNPPSSMTKLVGSDNASGIVNDRVAAAVAVAVADNGHFDRFEARNERASTFPASLSIPEDGHAFGQSTSMTFRHKKRANNDRPMRTMESPRYSPAASPRIRKSRFSSSSSSSRPADKARFFVDHVRQESLRSFYSDPRLSGNSPGGGGGGGGGSVQTTLGGENARPRSLYGNNL